MIPEKEALQCCPFFPDYGKKGLCMGRPQGTRDYCTQAAIAIKIDIVHETEYNATSIGLSITGYVCCRVIGCLDGCWAIY